MADAAVSGGADVMSAALHTLVVGKVLSARKYKDVFETVVVAPAPDQYSQPTPLLVRSGKPIGNANDLVSVPCRVGGYRGRSYNVTDQQTGEIRRVLPYHVTLDALN